MKRKFLPLLLAIALFAGILAGCSAPGGEPSPGDSTQAEDPAAQTEGQLGQFRTDATLAETVLVDEGGVKITATGLTYTAYSVDVALTIENNSGKDLSFVSGSLGYSCNSINGYMVNDGYLNCDVANGKKANDTISFYVDALMLYGIDEIADLEIGFSMTDDGYNTTYSGPRQLKTSAFDAHDYGADPYQETITSRAAMRAYGYEIAHFTQDALYEQKGVKLLSSGVMTNQDGEDALLLEVENTTDSMVYVTTADIALNGLLVRSGSWSSDAVNPGKRCIVKVELSSVLDPAWWAVYGITDIGAVSLSLAQRSQDGAELAAGVPVEVVIPGVNASFDGEGTEVYNNNGLRIVSKTVREDASDYSDDLYVLLLAENNSGRTLTIDDAYDSLSVNGYMTEYAFDKQELADGKSAVLAIKLWGSSLQANQVTSPSDIQDVEVGLEILGGSAALDQPTLTLQFDQQD